MFQSKKIQRKLQTLKKLKKKRNNAAARKRYNQMNPADKEALLARRRKAYAKRKETCTNQTQIALTKTH